MLHPAILNNNIIFVPISAQNRKKFNTDCVNLNWKKVQVCHTLLAKRTSVYTNSSSLSLIEQKYELNILCYICHFLRPLKHAAILI